MKLAKRINTIWENLAEIDKWILWWQWLFCWSVWSHTPDWSYVAHLKWLNEILTLDWCVSFDRVRPASFTITVDYNRTTHCMRIQMCLQCLSFARHFIDKQMVRLFYKLNANASPNAISTIFRLKLNILQMKTKYDYQVTLSLPLFINTKTAMWRILWKIWFKFWNSNEFKYNRMNAL